MKSLRYAVAALVIWLIISIGSLASPPAGAGITSSAHDFASTSAVSGSTRNGVTTPGWNAGAEVCRPCHTPHNVTLTDTNGVLLGAPLWNHNLSANTSYILYQQNNAPTGTGVNQTSSGVTGQVGQTTKLCLSCHDGTVALDSFSGAGTGGSSETITAVASWADVTKGTGNNLSTNHPYGDAARWPTNDITGLGAPGVVDLVDPSFRKTAGIMPMDTMYDGTAAVGCVSCHDPHNTAGNSDFLWVPNNAPGVTVDSRTVSGSLLCQNCHIK